MSIAQNELQQHYQNRRGVQASVSRTPRLTILDWLFWFVMFSVNLQDILELWGIDTIYKPYRVVSLLLGVVALPALFGRGLSRVVHLCDGPSALRCSVVVRAPVQAGGS